MALKTCSHGNIVTSILSSPIGELEIACCPQGIVSLGTVSKKVVPNMFKPDKRENVKILRCPVPSDTSTEKAVQWLQIYFTKPQLAKSSPVPPICHLTTVTNTSSFTLKVWKTLVTQVPLGTTISYGNLAVKSGGTVSASRAVGQAMRNNPVGIIVPCHRVVLSNGLIGNYSGGEKNCVKAWLLEHEQC